MQQQIILMTSHFFSAIQIISRAVLSLSNFHDLADFSDVRVHSSAESHSCTTELRILFFNKGKLWRYQWKRIPS